MAELSAKDRVEHLLTAWLVYLARITNDAEFQLGSTPAPKASRAGLPAVDALIASVVPMEITIDPAQDFAAVRRAVAAEWDRLKEHDGFARDLIARCPPLRTTKSLRSRQPWLIGMTIPQTAVRPLAICRRANALGHPNAVRC
ncbi:hypothetical protein [Sinorhizobium meliloti]|uniref:hypothetical protein n=1 Tax=Rhizobium meliloti TaxID=382 RepID=UPI0020912E63|nr:hypothetical protein [Sinorhizobium meliloti]MCO5966478.1 hypothetical protein [Sinorhizobium meliloti]